MLKKSVIVLADREWTINPLPIGVLRQLDLHMTTPVNPEEPSSAFDKYVQVISSALQSDYPEMSVDAVMKLRTDIPELMAAYVAILRHSGMLSGKVEAEAASQPTGVTSTAG